MNIKLLVLIGSLCSTVLVGCQSNYNSLKNKNLEVTRIHEHREDSKLNNKINWLKSKSDKNITIKISDKFFERCFPFRAAIQAVGGRLERYDEEQLNKITCYKAVIVEEDNNRLLTERYDEENPFESYGYRTVCELKGKKIKCVGISRDEDAKVYANPNKYPDLHTFRDTYILK